MSTNDRDLQAIAYLVGRLRDETNGANHWDGPGNMAALRKIQTWRLVDIMQAATTHGSDPTAKTPSALVKRLVTNPVQPERITSSPKAAEQCRECGKHRAFCQCALDARAREYEGARDDGPAYEPHLSRDEAIAACRLAARQRSRECHPRCDLGPDGDHPGYLGYRCIDDEGTPLPFPGEDDPATTSPLPTDEPAVAPEEASA